MKYLLIVLSLSFILKSVLSKGQVSLDSHSFDKILSKFKTTLVKFDIAYPYGPRHEEFLKVAESSINVEDFLVAEVEVKDYGDKDNEDLAKRFELNSKEFPIYLLFIAGTKDPYVYKGKTEEEYQSEQIINFVRSKDTGIYISAPGCLEDFDDIAKQFILSDSIDDKKILLKSAELLWDDIKTKSAQKSAEIYVKLMRKIIDTNDNDFLIKERLRLKKIITGKIAEDKKNDMKIKINILDSFLINLYKVYNKASENKEEL